MLRLGGALILPLALAAGAVLGGTVVTYLYDRNSSLVWRLSAGFCTGLAALGFIGFWLAVRYGLQPFVVVAAAILTALPAALLLRNRHRALLMHDLRATARAVAAGCRPLRAVTVFGAVAWMLGAFLLWAVARRTMLLRPDGIYTGVIHNFGDLPFHLNIIARFVHGDNFPPEHPSYAGVAFTYPFMADFVASMFVSAGLPIDDVMVWSTFALCAVLAVLIYRWTLDLTASPAAAALAPWVAFMNGGLGWWMFVREAGATGWWSTLAKLPHDYTITSDGAYRWGNLVTTLLMTQRGLLLGMPLAIVVFHNWWLVEHDADENRRHRVVAAGVIAGLLPLVHAHTYAIVVGLAVCLTLIHRDWRTRAPFFAWALALGAPQVWWMVRSSATDAGAFVNWAFGWDRGDRSALVFWLANTGLFIPLLVAAVAWRGRRPIVGRRLLLFYLPFTLCFIGPNVLRLAPWIWDNIKVLIYWFIASVPLVALLIARLSNGRWWRRALAGSAMIVLTLAGALDLWRAASGTVEWRVFNRREMEFADVIAANTEVKALVLHAPIQNHPVALTGRRSMMGHPGHVWSHGLDHRLREANIRRIYAGGANAARLLSQYRIDYVVVGPHERRGMPVDEAFFEQYPRVAELGTYRLYRVAGRGN